MMKTPSRGLHLPGAKGAGSGNRISIVTIVVFVCLGVMLLNLFRFGSRRGGQGGGGSGGRSEPSLPHPNSQPQQTQPPIVDAPPVTTQPTPEPPEFSDGSYKVFPDSHMWADMRSFDGSQVGTVDVATPQSIEGWYCHKDLGDQVEFILTVVVPGQDYVVSKVFERTIARRDVTDLAKDYCHDTPYAGFKVVPPAITTQRSQFNITVLALGSETYSLPFPGYGVTGGKLAPSVKFNAHYLSDRTPLPLAVDSKEPVRLNVLITAMNPPFTSNQLAVLHWCYELAQEGIAPRLINIDGDGMNIEKDLWPYIKQYHTEFDRFNESIEFHHDAFNVRKASEHVPQLFVNAEDQFAATSYLTVFMAQHSLGALKQQGGRKRIIYFIQEFEPLLSPHDTPYLYAFETYIVPHYAVFSTPQLQQYFEEKRLGVYEHCQGNTCQNLATIFQPAVVRPHQPSNYRRRSPKNRKPTLVISASRNDPLSAYETTLDVLSEAASQGVFGMTPGDWVLIGLGLPEDICYLGKIAHLCLTKFTPTASSMEYWDLLSRADIGLSIRLSSHPGTAVLDFAAAGMYTVTNSFYPKTAASLTDLSSNIIVTDPYLQPLIEGLKEAVGRVKARQAANATRQANLKWAHSWRDERSFGNAHVKKIESWLAVKGGH